jgi:sulfatase maturation enzyme AslB (radical SAM superfamily)
MGKVNYLMRSSRYLILSILGLRANREISQTTTLSPEFLVFPVTYRCNLSCKSCSCPEQAREVGEMDIEGIKKCLKYLKINSQAVVKKVNLTGGELFLRKDVDEIIEQLVHIGASDIGISSNGLNVNKTCETFEELLKKFPHINWGIQLSLDGPEKIHNLIRGNPKAYKSVLTAINQLLELRNKYEFTLSTNYTISQENIAYVRDFSAWMDLNYGNSIGRDYTFSIYSNLYINSQKAQISEQFNKKEYLENLYKVGIWLFREKGDLFAYDIALMTKGFKRFTPCSFQDQGYFLEPNGNLYKCSVYKESFIDSALEDNTISHDSAFNAYKRISHNCSTCFNNCGNYLSSHGYYDLLTSEYIRSRDRIYLASPTYEFLAPYIFHRCGISYTKFSGEHIGVNDAILFIKGSKYDDLINRNYYDSRFISIPRGALIE